MDYAYSFVKLIFINRVTRHSVYNEYLNVMLLFAHFLTVLLNIESLSDNDSDIKLFVIFTCSTEKNVELLVRLLEKELTIMNVTFLEGLRNLVVGLSKILLEKGKFLGVAILMTLFMTFFAIIWAGIALLLGVELNEVTGPIPYKWHRSMDYGSPVIWTISCIISAGITILFFFGIKSIFRRIRSKKSKTSALPNNPENRNGRPTD